MTDVPVGQVIGQDHNNIGLRARHRYFPLTLWLVTDASLAMSELFSVIGQNLLNNGKKCGRHFAEIPLVCLINIRAKSRG